MQRVKLFVSGVSREFKHLRLRLEAEFGDHYVVITQEQLKQKGGSLFSLLADEIRTSHAVIHFVGARTGDVIQTQQIRPFLHANAKFAQWLEKKIKVALATLTWTQVEFWLAKWYHKNERCFVYSVPKMIWPKKFRPEQVQQKKHMARIEKFHYHQSVAIKGGKVHIEGVLQQLEGPLARIRTLEYGFQLNSLRLAEGMQCLGRERFIRQLEKACATPEPRIVVLHGCAGSGKTTIVRNWLWNLTKCDPLRNKLRDSFPQVFARTFSGVGGEGAYAELERLKNRVRPDAAKMSFMDEALEHFANLGWKNARSSTGSKGAVLARALIENGGALILDSVESFQHLPTLLPSSFSDSDFGDLFRCLYDDLANSRKWLLILTSYWPIPAPTSGRAHHGYVSIELDALPLPAAVRMLSDYRHCGKPTAALVPVAPKAEGVAGRKRVLQNAALSVGCQPLALKLLASYVMEQCRGELRTRSVRGKPVVLGMKIPKRSKTDPSDSALHNRAIAMLWARRFPTPEDPNSEACMQILRCLSLFAGPVSDEDLAALCSSTETLLNPVVSRIRSKDALQEACSKLERLGIIDLLADGSLDLHHQLLREEIANEFARDEPQAWAAAHACVYDHLINATKEESPNRRTILLLARATAHGCRTSDRIQSAYDVAMRRLREEDVGSPSWPRIRARSDDLGLLANFFVDPWRSLRDGLDSTQKANLLNEVGYALQKLCKFRQSIEALHRSRRFWTGTKCKKLTLDESTRKVRAIRDLVLEGKSHLMELETKRAKRCAIAALKLADHLIRLAKGEQRILDTIPEGPLRILDAYSFAGWVAHVRGEREEAERSFEQLAKFEDFAAALDEDRNHLAVARTWKMLQHCQFLIECGRVKQALDRVRRAQEICLKCGPTRMATDIAFNWLLLGKCHAALYAQSGKQVSLQNAKKAYSTAERQCWSLDLMDGWLQVQLALTELALFIGDKNAANTHLEHAAGFARTVESKWFDLNIRLLRGKLALARAPRCSQALKQVLDVAQQAAKKEDQRMVAEAEKAAGRFRG